jgi:hypothetical protein
VSQKAGHHSGLTRDETECTLVQRAVDGDDVALRDEFLEVLDATSIDGLSSSCNYMSIYVKPKMMWHKPSGRGA